jgi:hypothetical protein
VDIGYSYIRVYSISGVLIIKTGYVDSHVYQDDDMCIPNDPSVTIMLMGLTYKQLDTAIDTLKEGKDFNEFMNAVKNGDIK